MDLPYKLWVEYTTQSLGEEIDIEVISICHSTDSNFCLYCIILDHYCKSC